MFYGGGLYGLIGFGAFLISTGFAFGFFARKF
jgi:hypothetical protein